MPNAPQLIKTAATQRRPAPPGVDEENARRDALDTAFEKAAASARSMAASLGVRLLGLHDRRETLTLEDGMLVARVELAYRVSRFLQWRSDLLTLPSVDRVGRLLKMELARRWFGYRYRSAGPSRPQHGAAEHRALVAGHFSIPGGGGTFGDIEAMEMVCAWLAETGIAFDIASNAQDGVRGVPLNRIDPTRYSHFIFVCGPWAPRDEIPALLLERFAHCRKIGINLTTFEEGGAGFDPLIARDSPSETRADLAFGRKLDALPVVGVLLILRQKAYAQRQRHLFVRHIVEEYLQAGEVAPLWLDTVASGNRMGLETPRQFESILRKTDAVVTNRLHGLVLSLKNAVPVVAIDAVSGGGKVTAQAKELGWPAIVPVEELSVERLRESISSCLSGNLAAQVRAAQQRGAASIEKTKQELLDILKS